MKEIIAQHAFQKDMARVARRGRHKDKIAATLQLLAEGIELPSRMRPHRLSGDWDGAWECHIAPDLLLIYQFDDASVTLIRLGSHSDLF